MITLLWLYVQSKMETPPEEICQIEKYLFFVTNMVSLGLCLILDIAIITFIFRR